MPVFWFVTIALAIAALSQSAHAQVRHQANVEAGRSLAVEICEECHVVARQQSTPSSLSGYGPSFFLIADNPDTTAQSLWAFLAHPHALVKMPYPELTPTQIADVSAYILSLRGKH